MNDVKETIAQEAKRLLSPIPNEKWLVGIYSDPQEEKCCGVGHWARLQSENPSDFSVMNCTDSDFYHYGVPFKKKALRRQSGKFFREYFGGHSDISCVNNGQETRYDQPNPKDRVMALLDDMIAAGY